VIAVGIDPGHGMDSAKPGVYDPGAVHGDVHEASIALAVGKLLADQCRQREWVPYMTRTSNADPMPLRERVAWCRARQCTAIVSIHCNSFHDRRAHGTETLYLASEWVASEVQRRLVVALGTRDRGAKQRDNLAMLRYERVAILVELAFLSNDSDRAILIDPDKQLAAAIAIADGLRATVRL